MDGGRLDTYPDQTDEDAPDETMFTFFPDGRTEQGVCRKPVDPYKDVRGRETETETSQGLGGGSRTRTCGHIGKLEIYSISDFLFSEFSFFVTDRDAERSEPTENGMALFAYKLSLPPPGCPPFYNTHPSSSSSPSPTSPPPLIPPPHHHSSSTMYSTSSSLPPPTPRPILKRNPSSLDRERKHAVVHFPPSPIISKTFVAHSPSAYDRSPIVVVPNSCALPERGCPGRTYTLDRNGRRKNEFGGLSTLFGGDDVADRLLPPPLMQDTSSSSSSDESSDGLAPLPSHLADSKHRKRGVRRQHKLSSTPPSHCSRSSFSDGSLRSDLLTDEGIFGGF